MMTKQTGDGGFSNPTMYKTIEEARAANDAREAEERVVAAMSPEDRAAWLSSISEGETTS